MITGEAENITTGIAKHENTVFIKSEKEGKWQYIGLYGKQALTSDDLGIVLFYDDKPVLGLFGGLNKRKGVLKLIEVLLIK